MYICGMVSDPLPLRQLPHIALGISYPNRDLITVSGSCSKRALAKKFVNETLAKDCIDRSPVEEQSRRPSGSSIVIINSILPPTAIADYSRASTTSSSWSATWSAAESQICSSKGSPTIRSRICSSFRRTCRPRRSSTSMICTTRTPHRSRRSSVTIALTPELSLCKSRKSNSASISTTDTDQVRVCSMSTMQENRSTDTTPPSQSRTVCRRHRPCVRSPTATHGATGMHVTCSAVNNGTMMVSATGNCTVNIWNTFTNIITKRLYGHTSLVISISVSSDSTLIVSGDISGCVRVWRVTSGTLISTIRTTIKHFEKCMISKCSKYVVVLGATSGIQVWDIYDGKHIFNVRPDRKYGGQMMSTVGADMFLTVHTNGVININNINLSKRVNPIKRCNSTEALTITALSVSTDYVAVGFRDSRVMIAPVRDDTCSDVITIECASADSASASASAGITTLEFSQDNRYIIVCQDDQDAQMWHIKKRVRTLVLLNSRSAIECSTNMKDECVMVFKNAPSMRAWNIGRSND